jgi:uncharacterized membrane protein YbhN (UPF0104 family)
VNAQLYASSIADPRARRPVDVLRAVVYSLALLGVALLSEIGADLDRAISEALWSFPGVFEVVWLLGFWGAVGWSSALVISAVVQDRAILAVEALVAAVLALGGTVAAAAVVTDDPSAVLERLVDVDGPPVFPPAMLAITSAVIAAMAPHLTLPWRRFGRVLVGAQVVGALFLGAAQALGSVAALAIGLLAGALIHVVAGSPGGLPTVRRVREALADLGLDVRELTPVRIRPEGVAVLAGQLGDDGIEIKVYGRDAWEGELVADLWRLAWYRGTQRRARLRRAEYVEHEGFMTFLAATAGLRVADVVTAGRADNGDALIAVRPAGLAVDPDTVTFDAVQVRTLWAELALLHRAGIVHHRIDLDRIDARSDGSVGFSDLSSASVRVDPADEIADRAQLFALTLVTGGHDTAIDELRAAIDDAAAIELLPYLQEAALPPHVRARLRRTDVGLDDVRNELVDALGADDLELAKVRRVTRRSIVNLALLAVAAYTIIGMISGLDLEAFARDLADANWWWIVAALVVGQLPRIANAVSTMGSTPQPLPLGPTAGLQFATCYVNLAVPSAAGRVAITTRFFQRFGIPPAAAVSAGVIDSLSEFVVQLALFVLILFISDVDLGLSLDQSQLNGIASTAFGIVVAALVIGAIALAIPAVRRRLTPWFREARAALDVLRTPVKLLQLFGGNVLSQVLFAVTLGACVRAFGFDVPLSSLILINTIVSLFAGLLPVPGGVGVTEAGISLGLSRVGVPAETAFAIALTYRFCTFYLPPIWGLRSYRWMTRHRYL